MCYIFNRSTDEKIVGIVDFQDYYCKSDLLKYKKMATNVGIDYDKLSKLNCNEY